MRSDEPIYLDHNATTPIRPEVIDAMAECARHCHANPASQHSPGRAARRRLEAAREEIAELLGADPVSCPPDRVILTSGGTEANNLALLGFCPLDDTEPGAVCFSAIEHASVIEPAERLLDGGWRVNTLPVDGSGVVRVAALESLVSPQTRLVSVTLGNHETGALQPVDRLAPVCHAAGVPIHTDAVQVAGKRPIEFRRLGVDAMTVAAHKFGGPIGIGALLISGKCERPPRPILHGGHQQQGLRPGTEAVAPAVGMATALRLWRDESEQLARRLTALRDRFESRLLAALPGAIVHAAAADRLPQTSNVAFPGVDGQQMFVALDAAGVACSIGAACGSGAAIVSPTLRSMGLPEPIVRSSLRFSLGWTTTEAEVDEAVQRIAACVERVSG